MEINRKKDFVILPSKDNNMHAMIDKGVYYYYLPKEQYEEYQMECGIMDSRLLKKSEENTKKEKSKKTEDNRKEPRTTYIKNTKTGKTYSMEEFYNNRRDVFKNRENYRRTSLEHKINKPIEKKEIKNNPSPVKEKTYTGSRKKRIKAFLATILVVATVTLSAMGVEKYGDYREEFGKATESVAHLSNNEIVESIEDILKQEISKGTGENIEDISISYEVKNSTEITEIKARDNTYLRKVDLRSFLTWGNTLEKGELTDIINAANELKGDRKALIKTLMKARKFSKEKDLVVDGDELKEVDAQKNDGEER